MHRLLFQAALVRKDLACKISIASTRMLIPKINIELCITYTGFPVDPAAADDVEVAVVEVGLEDVAS